MYEKKQAVHLNIEIEFEHGLLKPESISEGKHN